MLVSWATETYVQYGRKGFGKESPLWYVVDKFNDRLKLKPNKYVVQS